MRETAVSTYFVGSALFFGQVEYWGIRLGSFWVVESPSFFGHSGEEEGYLVEVPSWKPFVWWGARARVWWLELIN